MAKRKDWNVSPKITVRVPADVHATLSEQAAKKGGNLTSHVQAILAKAAGKKPPKMVPGRRWEKSEEK